MEMIAPKRIIIRLEHIFQGGEDGNLARPIEINLNVSIFFFHHKKSTISAYGCE